jgi:phosphatidylglycerol:prolipoprotein diacylglycerol transferase
VDGILIPFEPVLGRLGPFTIRWFGLLLLLGVAIGVLLTYRRAASSGTTGPIVVDAASWALPLGLIGSRFLHVIANWEYYATHPAVLLDLGSGGLDAWGALLTGALAAFLFCRARGVSFRALGDAAAPGLLVAELFGRIGSFVNGDGQGRPTSLPWGTLYLSNNALTPDFGVPRHPAQLYQGFADLAILAVLWSSRKVALPIGSRFWIAAGLYGLSRVVIGTVRVEPSLLLGLRAGQLIGLIVVVFATIAVWSARSRFSALRFRAA